MPDSVTNPFNFPTVPDSFDADQKAFFLQLQLELEEHFFGQQYFEGSVDIGGPVIFSGDGSGLLFGSCQGMEIDWTQANAAEDTWYDISDASMSDGKLHGVTHDGSGKLTVTEPGIYLALWAGAFEADAANIHFLVTFSVDGTEGDPGMNHFETVAVNREQAMSGIALLDLAANQTVNVSIQTTDAGTPDLFVDHLLIVLVQIGGT